MPPRHSGEPRYASAHSPRRFGITSRQQCAARWRADWGRRMEIRIMHTAVCHAVQVRRPDGRVVRRFAFRLWVVTAQVTVAEVIGQHKDHVRLLCQHMPTEQIAVARKKQISAASLIMSSSLQISLLAFGRRSRHNRGFNIIDIPG